MTFWANIGLGAYSNKTLKHPQAEMSCLAIRDAMMPPELPVHENRDQHTPNFFAEMKMALRHAQTGTPKPVDRHRSRLLPSYVCPLARDPSCFAANRPCSIVPNGV
jgi:hypothetical protein